PPGVLRVDPGVMIVSVVQAVDPADGLAAVDGLEQRHLREPHYVGVGRVDGQAGVVPGPLPQRVVAAGQLPGRAAGGGAERAALLGLDQGVDAASVGRGDGDADLAPVALGQAVVLGLLLQVFPGVAAVAGDVQAAPGAAGGELPRPAAALPQPGEDDPRV